MRSAREVLVAVVTSLGLFVSRPAAADDGGLDIAKADIATLEVGAGAIGTPDTPPPPDGAVSPDLTLGFLGARVEFLGLFVEALTFRASYQPAVGNGTLSGAVVDLQSWMIGSHYPDKPVCMAALSLCDEDTGYVGFGATVLEMQGDTIDERLGMRVVQGTFVGSVTPAFAPSWRESRLLPHIGASFDIVRDIPQDENTYLGRGVLGLDAKATAGPVAFTASFDWRPNFAEFVDDFILETRVGVQWRTHWRGWHDRDALTLGLELAHNHDSVPATAFGPERVPGAVDSLMARFVVAPAIFTIGPP
jgi:hypothetical protein